MAGKVTWWEQELARQATDAVNDDDAGGVDRPADSATVAEWRDYAEAVGVDLAGATTKAAIIAAVDDAGG